MRPLTREKFTSRKFWFGVFAFYTVTILRIFEMVSDVTYGALVGTIIGTYMVANVWSKKNGNS